MPAEHKFAPTLTDEQLAAHNARARAFAEAKAAQERACGPTEREQVLHILRARYQEPGITQAEFLTRLRRYKHVLRATRRTAERSAARS